MEDSLPLSGNRPHLESALYALVENGVNHSPPDKPVVVSARLAQRGALVVVTVQDQGKGISEGNQAKIFDRFFTTEAGQGGTGLGLAIVATVVQAHGGTVSLKSAPDQGACFELRLPVALS